MDVVTVESEKQVDELIKSMRPENNYEQIHMDSYKFKQLTEINKFFARSYEAARNNPEQAEDLTRLDKKIRDFTTLFDVVP